MLRLANPAQVEVAVGREMLCHRAGGARAHLRGVSIDIASGAARGECQTALAPPGVTRGRFHARDVN